MPDEFKYMADLLKDRSGLVLNQDKTYLLESRLMPVACTQGIKGVEELIQKIKTTKKEALIIEVTEGMTTNESFFFRDIKPFDMLKEHVLPHILEKCSAKESFRIWCAAASNGQEPYSLAMILKEEGAKLTGWKYDIVGTNISKQVLAKAQKELYSQFEVQRGLPITMLVKYFDKADDQWQLKPEIRAMVQYKYFNLLDNLVPLCTFDVVFCRNVLIYFDQPIKGKVLDGIAKQMPGYGKLFLGGAETVLGVSESFKPVQGLRGVHERKGV
ncbi:MAG: CheR family methyltransferase [Rhodospirillaceae bacterium]